MAIKKFHDELPHAELVRDDGWKPDATPRFGQILAEKWKAIRDAAGPKPRARPEARFRHSDANGCSRAIAYAALNLPVSDEVDLAGSWIMELGSRLHEQWQVELQEIYGPNAEIEVTVGEGGLAGHIDAIVRVNGKVIVIECKSTGGYAFQLAVGCRGKPEGPRQSAVVQAALNGYYAEADEVVIIYWARDAVSVQMAKRKKLADVGRFVAEWTMGRHEFIPIALAEISRVQSILDLLDQGQLPARKLPELGVDKVIIRPADGSWIKTDDKGVAIDAGTFFACEYCRYQTLCGDTGPHRQAIPEDWVIPVRSLNERD